MSLVKMAVPSAGGHPLMLPHDYDDLTDEGQRLARVNAARQWIIPRDPASTAETAIAGYRFFQAYYLRDDPESGFQSGFFDDDPLPTPPFHLDMVAANAVHALNVVGAPRGSAKSTVREIVRLWKLITRPQYSFGVGTASNRLARRWGTRMMLQITNNSRLFDDFAPEYDGRLRPPRGIAFGAELLYLENGSWVSYTTTGSRQRGERPFEFDLDDPEYDPDGESTDMARLRDETERLIFKVIMPMVLRAGRRLNWAGTLISKRHFLCRAFGDKLGSSMDSRFVHWNRIGPLKALYRLDDGTESSIWPEMWNVEQLHIIRDKLGPAQFRSEMQNDPGAGDNVYFFLEDERHGYTISQDDPLLLSEPWRSAATISFKRKGVPIKMPLMEFLRSASVFVTVDSAPTSKETSDYNAVAVLACTPFNELFVLDIYNRRVKEHVTALEALRMADKWRASAIGVELHSKSQGVFSSLSHLLGTRAEGIDPIAHLPALRPIKVGWASKQARISGLQYRFGDPEIKDPSLYGYGGLIKLPLYQMGRNREWDDLFSQIEGFNPDSEDGGLPHDDALDCVSMSQEMLVGLRKKPGAPAKTKGVVELLLDGETNDQNGIPLAYSVDWATMPAETVREILAARTPKENPTNVRSKV